MATEFSPIITSQGRGGGSFSLQQLDLHQWGERASPVEVLDHFRVSGRPFPPHPHAGFSAVTYVFEDSQASLRSRDSLGNDAVVGPGGLVWTQAGSGLLHEETPAEDGRELHGLQVFVNLSSKNKLVKPQQFRIENQNVPVWRSNAGDRVRVVVGSFAQLSSPLVPAEAFRFLDAELVHEIAFELEDGNNAIVYVLKGRATVSADGRDVTVAPEQAVALHGSGTVNLQARDRAHVLVLSGAAIGEPVISAGPFIMNDKSQVEDAFARYRAGGMGRLELDHDT